MSLARVDLPAPVGPDEGHRLPRRDAQVDVAQHRHAGVVAEGHVVEDDLPLDGRELHGVGRLGDGGLGREQGAQLEDRGLALLEAVVLLHQQLDGGEEPVQVQEEGDQRAEGEGVVHHHVAADPEQRGLSQPPHQLGARAVDGVDLGGVDVGVAVLTHDVAVMDDVEPLAVVGGDHPHAVQALGQVRHDVGDAVAHPVVAPLGRHPEPQRHDHEGGDHQQHRDEGERRRWW